MKFYVSCGPVRLVVDRDNPADAAAELVRNAAQEAREAGGLVKLGIGLSVCESGFELTPAAYRRGAISLFSTALVARHYGIDVPGIPADYAGDPLADVLGL